MCDGGVATWNRSSGPSPSASHQCRVARPIERCVCRTALGSPVVPELKTRTASSVSSPTPTSRSCTAVGQRGLERRRVVEIGRAVRSEVSRQQRCPGAVGDGVRRCR